MTRRLNIWDFDDTLAWSHQVVERFKRQHPEVESWKWWHDDEKSLEAVLEALPIESMWEKLEQTPGEQWILTGRNLKSVKEWLRLWGDHPEIGKGVRKVENVLSTSKVTKDPIGVALRKRDQINRLLQVYDEIHVYEDSYRNIQALKDLGGNIHLHLVQNGQVKAASTVDPIDKDLHLIFNAMQSLQGLQLATDTKTYQEVFREVLTILRSAQKDILKGLSTEQCLEISARFLRRNKVELMGDIPSLADELDRGYQVDTQVRFDERLSEFYRNPLRNAYRALYSLMLSVEATFDRLQMPVVCRVSKPIYERDRLPVGFEILLWKVGEEQT